MVPFLSLAGNCADYYVVDNYHKYENNNMEYEMSYETQLISIGIKLNEPFTRAKAYHSMTCMSCNHTWSATPLSKLQAFKKRGRNGCPKCNDKQTAERLAASRRQNIQTVLDRGLTILSDWSGARVCDSVNTPLPVTVQNTDCGHVFTAAAVNLLSRGVNCPICARVQKNANIAASSKQRSAEWQKTASQWKLYKSAVTKLTKQHYKQHKSKINPTNLPTGRAGTEGAYHIDHIVPIRYCYNNNIPIDVCAHPDNLQMLGWRENVGSRDHLKENIPAIFTQYIK